jgi:hypothetical protein
MPATKVTIRRVPREDGPLIRMSYLVTPPPGKPGRYQHFDFPPEVDQFEVPVEVANEAIETGHFELDPESGMKPKDGGAQATAPVPAKAAEPAAGTPGPQTPPAANESIKTEGGNQ